MKGLILFGRVMNVYIHGNVTIAQYHAPIYYVILYKLSRPFRFCHVVRHSTTSPRPATASLQFITVCHVDDKITPVHRIPVKICNVPRRSISARDRSFPIWYVLLRAVTSTHDCHRVLWIAFLLQHHYDEPRVTTCNELGVCQGSISHNNEQTQSVEGIIWFN